MDTLDRMLDIASTPNWVTPMLSIFSQLRGHTVGITIDRDEYAWANATLQERGIKAKYVQFSGELCMFNVNVKQARYAKYLLGID